MLLSSTKVMSDSRVAGGAPRMIPANQFPKLSKIRSSGIVEADVFDFSGYGVYDADNG